MQNDDFFKMLESDADIEVFKSIKGMYITDARRHIEKIIKTRAYNILEFISNLC